MVTENNPVPSRTAQDTELGGVGVHQPWAAIYPGLGRLERNLIQL